MIDIFALIFLCRKNGNLALQKGLSAGTWKLYTILGWFGAEIIGLFFGMKLFGNFTAADLTNMSAFENSNIYGLMAIGLISAFGGYLFVKATLEKKPDSFDEDINKISVSDLRPPQKS